MSENFRSPFGEPRLSFIEKYGRSLIRLYTFLAVLLFLSSLFGCTGVVSQGKAPSEEQFTSIDSVSKVIEAGVVAVGGAADDEVGESRDAEISALRCSERAGGKACHSKQRMVEYQGCVVGTKGHTVVGKVFLTYSHSDCEIQSAFDEVVREIELTQVDPSGASWEISGGTRLTRLSPTKFEIELLGLRERHFIQTKKSSDLSLKTTDPLQVETAVGLLERNGRKITSGTVEINHNEANYVARLVFKEVRYSAGCCYPTSGQVAVSFIGSRVGSGNVKFTGCGDALFDLDGEITPVQFSFCE